MVLVATSAPKAYDYDYCSPADDDLAVIMARFEDRTMRLVWIPDNRVRYQTDRYRSGSYMVVIFNAPEVPR